MITFEQVDGSGIGMNMVLHVLRDGEHVANISRSGRSTWRINSVHYWETLGACKGIDEIKTKARELTYPTAHEVYEKLCAERAITRRNYIEGQDARKLARLVRDMIAGSNSARTEIDELVTEWDRFAADRNDTHTAAQARFQAYNESLGEGWQYNPARRHAPSPGAVSGYYPYYPEPPQ